jgi:hypothetical protein
VLLFKQLPDRYTDRMRFYRSNGALVKILVVSRNERSAFPSESSFARRRPFSNRSLRHLYFLGEIDEAAWESLHSDTSRPLLKRKTGRIAVKVINHLGGEVMKVFAV